MKQIQVIIFVVSSNAPAYFAQFRFNNQCLTRLVTQYIFPVFSRYIVLSVRPYTHLILSLALIKFSSFLWR